MDIADIARRLLNHGEVTKEELDRMNNYIIRSKARVNPDVLFAMERRGYRVRAARVDAVDLENTIRRVLGREEVTPEELRVVTDYVYHPKTKPSKELILAVNAATGKLSREVSAGYVYKKSLRKPHGALKRNWAEGCKPIIRK